MALENFDQLLEKYAELIVTAGVNVQEGHTVVVSIDVDQAPLARKITKAAYEKGAKRVILKWGDDKVSRLGFEHQSTETLTDIPDYRIEEMNYIVEQGATRINVVSNDPDALKGLDGEKNCCNSKSSR